MKPKVALICIFIISAFGIAVSPAHADPIQVRVCEPMVANSSCFLTGIRSLSPPINFESTFPDLGSDTDYIPRVLAQEWPSASAYQSLEAGAIAIRTFAQRELGCGAFDYINPADGLMVLNDHSQHYYGGRVLAVKHHNAVQWTVGINAFNTLGNRACAKYKANNGNATGQGAEEPTLWATWDAVDTNCNLFTPCGPNAHLAGLSQNGTHAWELSIGPNSRGFQSAPWTWQHMLSHYYTGISFAGGSNSTFVPIADSRYRWAWVNSNDIANTTFFETRSPCDASCERYRATYSETPATMTIGQPYNVWFILKNISTADWLIDGYYPTMMGYRWYFMDGSPVPRTYWPDNNLTPLPQRVNGGFAPQEMTAAVYPPNLAGWFILEWDLYQVNWNWYKEAGGGGATATQRILVAVDVPKRVIVYDDVFYGEVTANNAYLDAGNGANYVNLGFIGWANRISSLRVPVGCTVTLGEYENFQGSTITFTGYDYDLRDNFLPIDPSGSVPVNGAGRSS